MKGTRILCAVLFCFSYVFFSCTTLTDYEKPYIVGNVTSLCGDGDASDGYLFAGVSFTFYNSSSKVISDFSVSFRLYDSEGENPFIGSNCVSSTNKEIIGPNSTSEVVVSLDDFITVMPEEPYQIDYFYVTRIHYSDGSSWKDEYGIYAL